MLLIALFLLLSVQAFAQSPEIVWAQTFGGADYEYGQSICMTSDGNYVTAGFMAEGSDSTQGDILLIKINPTGDVIWTKILGGPEDDYAYCVRETSDGGFILGGYTIANEQYGQDSYLLKTDSEGNEIWHKNFGGAREDVCYSVRQTFDGGYIMAGNSNSFINNLGDMYVVKTDANGNLQWENIYGGMDHDGANCVVETAGGDLLFGGWTYSFGQGWIDAYLVKTNSDGDTVWTHTYGGYGRDSINDIIEIEDECLIFTGRSCIADQNAADVYLTKLNSDGSVVWEQTYGTEYEDIAYCVNQMESGNLIIVGSCASFGFSETDIYLIKTDSNGDSLWTANFGGTDFDVAHSLVINSDSSFVMAGATASYGAGSWDYYVIKVAEPLPSSAADVKLPAQLTLNQNYPNPFNASTVISFTLNQPLDISLDIYDIMGRKVETLASGNYPAGDYSVAYDCSKMSAGIYLYRLSTPVSNHTMKMNLIK
jgi:hypothetical protein